MTANIFNQIKPIILGICRLYEIKSDYGVDDLILLDVCVTIASARLVETDGGG